MEQSTPVRPQRVCQIRGNHVEQLIEDLAKDCGFNSTSAAHSLAQARAASNYTNGQ
jgi:hypothetical protein